MPNLETLARGAAVEASAETSVGALLERINEAEENVVTFRFESKLKGYVGWSWSVSLFEDGDDVTISEVNLVAGEKSILAPQWVPWAERLADYKALQAALEAQAAEEAAEAAAAEAALQGDAEVELEVEEETDEPEDNFEELEEIEEDLATATVPEADATENNANEASSDEPGFFRLFRRNKKRK
jgi:hypothetical protein